MFKKNKKWSYSILLKGIYMLKIKPQQYKTLEINSVLPAETIASINTYIRDNDCENLNVDISAMNIIDTCYISTICSANHFTKYPTGKINWKVSSLIVEEFNRSLDLGNCSYCL